MIGYAHAKLNLSLVVGCLRQDGKHEVLTVLQRLDLADRLEVVPADRTAVEGFAGDTLVASALAALDTSHGWHVTLDKRVPVAAGLGGGSSDAATALRLANAQLPRPVTEERLRELAASLGSDVPFFLHDGPQLGTGDGTTLRPLRLPQDYAVCVLLPRGARKESTAAVYRAFDARGDGAGFADRAAALQAALTRVRVSTDLAALPRNDLASSTHASALVANGAFLADVSGAGPAVYGLFADRAGAEAAAQKLAAIGECHVANPAW